MSRKSRLAAIVFTDITSYSLKMQINEEQTLELLQKHNELLFPIIEAWDGNLIKRMGDGLMISFDSAMDAVRCSLQIQKALQEYNSGRQENDTIMIRIGIHLGDIWFDNDDAYGDGVNIAARIHPLADPGNVCISQDIYNLIYNKVDLKIQSLGHRQLKNIQKELEVYQIITSPSTLSSGSDSSFISRNDRRHEHRNDHKHQRDRWRRWVEDESPIPDVLEKLPDNVSSKVENFIQKTEDWFNDSGKENMQRFVDKVSGWANELAINIKGSKVEQSLLDEIEKAGSVITMSEISSRIKLAPERIERHLRPLEKKGFITVSSDGNEQYLELFEPSKFRELINEKIEKEKKEFREHLIAFISVNGFLAGLNLFVTGADFLWFLFPLAGWGIGLVNHIVASWNKRKMFRKMQSFPRMKHRLYKALEKLYEQIGGLYNHLASYVSVLAFLFGINLVFSPDFLWAGIVAGGWGIGVLGHLAAYPRERKKLEREVQMYAKMEQQLTAKGIAAIPEMGKLKGSYRDLLKEAHSIHGELADVVAENKSFDDAWKEEMKSLMDNYLKSLAGLASKANFVNSVIESFSRNELLSNREDLVQKKQKASDSALAREYELSLETIDKQINSIEKLTTQKEKLDVKLNTSLLSLKQLRIELARLETVTQQSPYDPMDSLREKNQELSDYFEIFDSELADLSH